jgi:hypothetical protein
MCLPWQPWAKATAAVLLEGPSTSSDVRQRLAVLYGVRPDVDHWPRFVNNHAWALVRLQQQNVIQKLATGLYELASGAASTVPPDDLTSSVRCEQPLPRWADDMTVRATWKNAKRWQAGPFGEGDLRDVWSDCGGSCRLTGRPFRETQVGAGTAKKPFAPSLDRIDPTKPYPRENCRLVLQAVDFALNSWGDEVFEEITLAAVRHRHGKRG